MKAKIASAIGLVIVVLVALGGIKALQFKTMAAKPWVQPPDTISSAVAHEEDWQDTFSAVGTISAVQGVTVTPEVAGTVSDIEFESGAVVSKGDLLVRLDTTTEAAQLKAAQAQLQWARVTAERTQTLRTNNTVSQSELDQAEAALKQAKANADAIQAAIDKKTIRAPFSGKLGIRQVNLGEYLDAGKPIVSLQSLTPVYADFSLPQQALAQVKTDMTVRVTLDTYTNKDFQGKLTAINPDLDQATRMVALQATLDNPEHLLRPGMFARVEVLLPTDQKVLVIPKTAVLSAPYGDSVYLIQKGTNGPNSEIVQSQFVRVGRSRGDFVSIESGLKPGDKVVSSGLFKLRNGGAVTENNQIEPKASENPKPSES